jgi:DNA polymerase-4
MSGEVGARLRRSGLVARTIAIKIRFADFRTVTRAHTLAQSTDLDADVHRWATQLYRGMALDRPRVRLVGVRADQLSPAARAHQQLELDWGGGGEPARRAAEGALSAALDRARERFGDSAVQPGTLTQARDSAAPAPRRG